MTKDGIKKDIGEIMRLCRKQRGLTARQLSELSGVGVAQVSNIERGKSNPGICTYLKLLGAMGYDIDVFSVKDRPTMGRSCFTREEQVYVHFLSLDRYRRGLPGINGKAKERQEAIIAILEDSITSAVVGSWVSKRESIVSAVTSVLVHGEDLDAASKRVEIAAPTIRKYVCRAVELAGTGLEAIPGALK